MTVTEWVVNVGSGVPLFGWVLVVLLFLGALYLFVTVGRWPS